MRIDLHQLAEGHPLPELLRRVGGIAEHARRRLIGGVALPCLTALALLLGSGSAGAAVTRDDPYPVPEAPPHCTAHFCIHYVRTGEHAPNLRDTFGAPGVPDYVEVTGFAAEAARDLANRRLGWVLPKSDGQLGGGNGLTDIYITDLTGLARGTTQPDDGQTGSSRSSSIQIGTNSHFDPEIGGSLWTLVAHEYAHVLQDTYDAGNDSWFSEGTANWMEDQFRRNSSADDIFNFVEDSRVPLTDKAYGSVIWNHWLAGRYEAAIIRRAWEGAARTRPASFAPAAYERALRRSDPIGFRSVAYTFAEEFTQFATALAEWRSGGFPGFRLYPDVARRGSLRLGRALSGRLSHTAFLFLSAPRPRARALTLEVSFPRNVKAGIALVGRRGSKDNGRLSRSIAYLPRGGTRRVSLAAPSGFARITAVLVNADTSQRGWDGDWKWTRDRIPFQARVIARR